MAAEELARLAPEELEDREQDYYIICIYVTVYRICRQLKKQNTSILSSPEIVTNKARALLPDVNIYISFVLLVQT